MYEMIHAARKLIKYMGTCLHNLWCPLADILCVELSTFYTKPLGNTM